MAEPTTADEEAVTRALAKQNGETSLATPVATAEYKQITDAMGENYLANEIQYSRLAILQQLSPEVNNQMPGYNAGMIVDNLTREIYSVKMPPIWLPEEHRQTSPKLDMLLLVPIFKLPPEFIKWKDRNTEGPGMHWKTLDATEERVRQGTWRPIGYWEPAPGEKKSPPVTQNLNMLCAVLNPQTYEVISQMMVVTFAKTSFQAGKKLLTYCANHRFRNLPFWGVTYYLYTVKKSFGNNSAYVFSVYPGKMLQQINPDPLFQNQIYQVALGLADKQHGADNQRIIINSAVLMEGDEGGEDDGEGDPLAGTPAAGGQQPAEDIPF